MFIIARSRKISNDCLEIGCIESGEGCYALQFAEDIRIYGHLAVFLMGLGESWQKKEVTVMQYFDEGDMRISEALIRIRERVDQLTTIVAAHHSAGESSPLRLGHLNDLLKVVEQIIQQTTGANDAKRRREHEPDGGCIVIPEVSFTVPSGTQIGRWAAVNRFFDLERNQLQCIFSATTNLVMVTNHEGLVTLLNPAAEHFFAGRSWRSVPFWQLLELPGSELQQVLSTYTPEDHHEIYLAEAGQWFNLRLVPFDPHAQVPAGFILILNDITWLVDSRQHLEKLVAERTHALANSEKMLRLIFDSVGNGILLLSDDYHIVKANHRAGQIHACPPDELVGKDLRDLTDNQGRWTLISCVAALNEESSMGAEIQVRRSDGSMLPASFMVTRVEIDGRIFWPVIVRDISRQKALEERLLMEKQQVEEMNVTLRTVMKSVDGDRKEFENNLARRIRTQLLPALDRVGTESSATIRASYLDLVREQLVGLTSGSASEIDASLLKLSKTEIRICQFVQAGRSTKDICEAMNLAFETVQTHRKNIRRKLGLRGKNVNLHSYLIGRRSLLASENDI